MKTDAETLATAARMGREARANQTRITTADVAATGRPAPEETAPPNGAQAESERAESEQVESAQASLLPEALVTRYRAQWQEVQADFVDSPRSAVERGDALVAEVMQQLAELFATERAGLEQAWSGGGEPSTEDLRIAVQRYRSFFERLMSL